MNSVILSGRICREIKLKVSSGGKLCGTFTIAADNGDHVDEIPVVVWEKPAREIFQRATVGDVIEVRGSIRRSIHNDIFVKLDKWQPIALRTPQRPAAASMPQLSTAEQADAYAALCERLHVRETVRFLSDFTAISAAEIDKTVKAAVWAIVQMSAAESEICAPAVRALTPKEFRRIASCFVTRDDAGAWRLRAISNMQHYIFKVLQNMKTTS